MEWNFVKESSFRMLEARVWEVSFQILASCSAFMKDCFTAPIWPFYVYSFKYIPLAKKNLVIRSSV